MVEGHSREKLLASTQTSQETALEEETRDKIPLERMHTS